MIQMPNLNPTTPDLRIVDIEGVFPHERYDPQRSSPLKEVIKQATVLTNPPIVAEIEEDRYVILDGSNRLQTFKTLGYQHLLVQVVDYDSTYVDLGIWQHVISHWEPKALKEDLQAIQDIRMEAGWQIDSLAQLIMHDGGVWSININSQDLRDRNAMLCTIVDTYHHRATLYRTALTNPQEIWKIYEGAIALVMFPTYTQADIIKSAKENAFLPPGISRHMIHGRALMVNYPLTYLQDISLSLEAKNAQLQNWVQQKFAQRQVRYYAESTYLFNE